MKNLLKIVIVVVLGSLSTHVAAQKKSNFDTAGFYVNMDNEKSYVFERTNRGIDDGIWWDQNNVYFLSENGKQIKKNRDSVQWMMLWNRAFLCLPRNINDDKSLATMELLAVNSKYILACWDENYFVFDINLKSILVQRPTKFSNSMGGEKKHNREVVEELRRYFADCSDLIKGFTDNIEAGKPTANGMAYLQCAGAPSFESILETANSKHWYDQFRKKQM